MFPAVVIKNENSSLAMVKLFLEMGVKASQPDNLLQTPLYYAAREGHNQVIDLLIQNGC